MEKSFIGIVKQRPLFSTSYLFKRYCILETDWAEVWNFSKWLLILDD